MSEHKSTAPSSGLPTKLSKVIFFGFDLRATHARTLQPAALASEPFWFV
jgi:hypothetical protein